MVKNPSDERKQLNRGDVLMTCFRLCTGLSPGIGDMAENPAASLDSNHGYPYLLAPVRTSPSMLHGEKT